VKRTQQLGRNSGNNLTSLAALGGGASEEVSVGVGSAGIRIRCKSPVGATQGVDAVDLVRVAGFCGFWGAGFVEERGVVA